MHVIGAGPVGSYTAYLLAREGFRVKVYEEHTRIGKPEHCAGIISRNIEQFVRKPPHIQFVHGARFFAGREFALLERKKAAYIIDRPSLDRMIAEMAEAEGASFELGRRVSWKELEGRIVAADGATSTTRYELGQRVEFLPALQFDLRERMDDYAELWFEPWNRDFFVWVIPRGSHVRVGTASRNLKPLEDFVWKRFGRKRIRAKYSGLVIVSGPVRKTYFRFGSREVALVGDAAGQVKPTTGGGVVTGLTCAKELAGSIAEGSMGEYEKRWRKKFGREFALQKVARWLILRNPEAFVRFVRRSRARFELYGDMDVQSRVVLRLLPQLFLFVLETLIF